MDEPLEVFAACLHTFVARTILGRIATSFGRFTAYFATYYTGSR